MNLESSRSHQVIRIVVESRPAGLETAASGRRENDRGQGVSRRRRQVGGRAIEGRGCEPTGRGGIEGRVSKWDCLMHMHHSLDTL